MVPDIRTFSRIEPPWWDDRPTIIVGSAPSLRGFDFSQLEGLGRVLAVKAALNDLPFANAFWSQDLPYNSRFAARLGELAKSKPVYIAIPDERGRSKPADYFVVEGATYIRRLERGAYFSFENYEGVECGCTSGFGAFSFSVLKRARRVVLFGLDYSGDKDGFCHYDPKAYYWYPKRSNTRYWPRWAKEFDNIAPLLKERGVEVLNASPASTITGFPKCSVDEGVQALRAMQ